MSDKSIDSLRDITPQQQNANRHTERGMGELEKSVQADGWIGAITVANDGETFDGSARAEIGVNAGFDDAIVVESDGSRPVIVRRTDIPTADDPRAKRLGVAANRVPELNLNWDASVLDDLQQADWTHADVIAFNHYHSMPVPPCYSWPNGFVVGTGPWAARQYTRKPGGTETQAWREVYAIDPQVVKDAATKLPGAARFLEELAAGTVKPLGAAR